MNPNDAIFLYVTTPDLKTAEKIVETLLAESLIACANIGAQMQSLYHWQGKLERATEVPMILKTTESRRGAATARIVGMHPAEVPCVVAWPLSGGYEPYLQWLRGSL